MFGTSNKQLDKMHTAVSWVSDPLDLLGGRKGQMAAKEQQKAQDALKKESQARLQEQKDTITGLANEASLDVEQGKRAGLIALGQGNKDAQGRYDVARDDLSGSLNNQLSSLQGGYGTARDDIGKLTSLQGHAAGATQAIGASDVMGQRQDRVGAMLDRQGGMYAGFEQDPGYAFRQQQGEQAINRAAAAGGGRHSGRTMKALAQFNSGLASQEFQNFANRRAQEMGAAGQSDANQQAALLNQAGRQDAAALAAQQNQMGLAQMGYGAQGQLAEMAAKGGESAAAAQGQAGQGLASLQEARAASDQAAGQAIAGMHQNAAQSKAAIKGQTAQTLGSLASEQNAVSAGNAQYAGMVNQAGANTNKDTMNAVSSVIGGLFSDARLKCNIREVPGSRYESIGLRGVEWTWNRAANSMGLIGADCGVIAQDVLALYPDAVGVGEGGYMTVDYGKLNAMLAGDK